MHNHRIDCWQLWANNQGAMTPFVPRCHGIFIKNSKSELTKAWARARVPEGNAADLQGIL
ncbi:MAG: hypothetical protein HRT83_04630 [Hyphomicrobiaceae bacterium]|nr:hypothetical protein [Hyphomicrobiaceae bacterium]